MENKQYWGVCIGNEIVKVYSTYEVALEESVMWTLETGAEHTVKPVKMKKEESQ